MKIERRNNLDLYSISNCSAMIKPLGGFVFDLDVAHLPILYSPVFRQVYFSFRFKQVLKIPFDVFCLLADQILFSS